MGREGMDPSPGLEVGKGMENGERAAVRGARANVPWGTATVWVAVGTRVRARVCRGFRARWNVYMSCMCT